VFSLKNPDFAKYLSSFLVTYLPGTLNLSENTIESYRDSYKLFLTYWEQTYHISPDKLSIEMVTESAVHGFLTWLEKERGCSISTRNQRLAALRSFFRYVQRQCPEHLYEIQKILTISAKRAPSPWIQYLTPEDMEIILSQPSCEKKAERRDLVLLALMYDTAARVQEIIDLKVRDVRFLKPSVVSFRGKGNKQRIVPIMENTSFLLKEYLTEQKLDRMPPEDDSPLFLSQQKSKLTRKGVSYILNKYVERARKDPSFTGADVITCHVLRHSRASHMLQAGIPLIYIRDLLGHSSITSTEIYARLNIEIKRKAIEQAHVSLNLPDYPSWHENRDIMDWLSKLI
jgi:site-specific recombinase XerD